MNTPNNINSSVIQWIQPTYEIIFEIKNPIILKESKILSLMNFDVITGKLLLYRNIVHCCFEYVLMQK